MNRYLSSAALLLISATFACAQKPDDPFPAPINTTDGAVTIKFNEFATIPNAGNEPPRMTLLVDEPATRRYFVNDMRGPLYSVSYDGKSVAPYLDINAQKWGVPVQSQNNERGFQSFAFHPQFAQRGAPGYGKFYTLLDTTDMTPAADFKPSGTGHTHDTVLLEWTAKDAAAATYDGAAPRELMRWAQPFPNHNCGHMTFNPLARPGSPDYGLLYFGMADGGSGGDPYKHAQNLGSGFGKIFRIDPLGKNSANGKYGIPASNPFVKTSGALPAIYAYGIRNTQRLFWDSKNGNMFMSDIGQNIVEEISPVTAGANLGWNDWEGSYRFISRQAVDLSKPRNDDKVTFPIVEYGQIDPLFQPNSAAIGGFVYRAGKIKSLANLLVFGDNPSGEIFYVSADNLPKGGQSPIRRILLDDRGTPKKFLDIIKQKNSSATRADLRFGEARDGRVFILNKWDGIVRELVP